MIVWMFVNFHGTMHILEVCKNNEVPRLVFPTSQSTRFTGGG